MRVLVTGGSGYIGAQTVRRLARAGSAVVVVDRVDPPAVLGPSIERFVAGDIRTPGLLDEIFATDPIDAVIHLAADKSVEASVRDPGRYFDNNVNGTLCLVEAMHRADVGSIIFSSTCAVYGTPDTIPVTESSALGPESPYGASKLMAETILQWYALSHGLRYISLRYFNAAGADPASDLGEDWTDAQTLVPRVIKATLGRSGPLTVHGTDYPTPDGTAVRDYIHILDLADAHAIAVDHVAAAKPSLTLNLGTGTGTSVLEVIAATEAVAGRPVPVTMGPRRPGDAVALWADNRLAREQLGWQPTRSMRNIIETAWLWHSTHPDA